MPGHESTRSHEGEPTDDELLRYLDGAMNPQERTAFGRRLQHRSSAAARLEVLAIALAENGWPTDWNPLSN